MVDLAPTTEREGVDDPMTVEGNPSSPRTVLIAFETLYHEQFLSMVKFATLMTGNREVARDIVQDAFVRLHVKWAGVEYPKAYLRTSVVNGCRSRARWERRRRGRRLADEPTVEQRPEELNDVLARLSTRQRAAIVLRFYEQHSEVEIARILHCRPGTVGSLISRGLVAMKHELTEPELI